MGGVDHDHVHAGVGEALGALLGAGTDADCRGHAQATVFVLGGERVLGGLHHVLDGDEAAQLAGFVHHQHALEAVHAQQLARLFQAGALAHGDEAVLRRHDLGDELVEIGLEASVAVGDDADDLAALDHRHAGETVLALQRDDLADGHRRRDGDRILEDARLVTLDLVDLARLLGRVEVLVHHANPAFLRERDRQAAFSHRVHGSGHQRDVEADAARDLTLQAHIARKDRGVGRNEKDVIEGQRLLDHSHGFFPFDQIRIIQSAPAPRKRLAAENCADVPSPRPGCAPRPAADSPARCRPGLQLEGQRRTHPLRRHAACGGRVHLDPRRRTESCATPRARSARAGPRRTCRRVRPAAPRVRSPSANRPSANAVPRRRRPKRRPPKKRRPCATRNASARAHGMSSPPCAMDSA